MYKRIIILGGSGSGKSLLANRISEYTTYPVYHLDNLFLESNWKLKDKRKWEELSKVFLSKETGVVDGNYTSSLPSRIQWADLIIFIDISTPLRLYRVFWRYIRIKIGLDARYGSPENSKEKIQWSFIVWVYNWNRSHRKNMFSMLDSIKDKKVVIISRPKELNIEELLK